MNKLQDDSYNLNQNDLYNNIRYSTNEDIYQNNNVEDAALIDPRSRN